MKFTINKSDILDILSKVQGITGRKSNLAITANILIKSTETGISFAATDLETGFEGFYPAEVEKPGIITINARKFFEIVQNFPNDDILIHEKEPGWIEIGNDKIEYHIVGMNADDFPDVPKIEDVSFFDIDSASFKKMIEKVIMIAASGDEKRAHITGVNFERIEVNGNNVVRMASTDGRRLSKVDYICGDDSNFDSGSSVIVPKKGLSEVNKFLDSSGNVQVGIKNNHFVIKKDNETIIIGLLEGDFPEYKDIIGIEDENSIALDKKMFSMMLKRMSILSSESYKSVIFNFIDNKLIVTASNPDLGESKEDIDVDFSREPVEVAFNPKYFIDTLNVIDEDEIVLNLRDGENPCIVKGSEDNTFLSVIMPMKI